MRGLSGSEILKAWEAGQQRRSPDRAVVVLRVGFPERGHEDLSALSVGQRDDLLLTLREGTFGDTLLCFAQCPRCEERLEFTLRSADFRSLPPKETAGELEHAGFRIRFRLPSGRDLGVVSRLADPGEAYRRLLDLCVLEAEREGEPVQGGDLPGEVAAALAARMAEMDPGADQVLDLGCPSCGHGWQAPLDVESFFWAEIAAQARRLLGEVHSLARAYGWDEAAILGMSSARRQAYLGMVGG